MLPTLQSGDLILVNKFSYGLRLPVLDKKVVDIGSRSTCSCSVIRWIRTWTIKRVVGLPGDEVAYLDKKLYINGELVAHVRDGDYFEPDRVSYIAQYKQGVLHLDEFQRSEPHRPIQLIMSLATQKTAWIIISAIRLCSNRR